MMIPADKLYFDNFWDVQKVLIMQNLFKVIPAFWIVGLNLIGLFVFILQFLQLQLY